MLAEVRRDVGPNTIVRENTQRKMVIMANVSGRDLGSVVEDMQARIAREVRLPEGYHVVYGGQFESQERASRTLLLLGIAVVIGIFLVLQLAFESSTRALIIMANLPLALIGGVSRCSRPIAFCRSARWWGSSRCSGSRRAMASCCSRTTSTYGTSRAQHSMKRCTADRFERLSPVLMTALCAGLALVPLVIASGEPGNEIQAPMGVVILGGLLTSTLLNLFVVPALYLWTTPERRGQKIASTP